MRKEFTKDEELFLAALKERIYDINQQTDGIFSEELYWAFDSFCITLDDIETKEEKEKLYQETQEKFGFSCDVSWLIDQYFEELEEMEARRCVYVFDEDGFIEVLDIYDVISPKTQEARRRSSRLAFDKKQKAKARKLYAGKKNCYRLAEKRVSVYSSTSDVESKVRKLEKQNKKELAMLRNQYIG